MLRYRKRTPFTKLPRRRRKAGWIDAKNRIRRDAKVLGGKFTTHQHIHGRNGWIDIYFLGRNAPVFYNAALATTRFAYAEAVDDRAWDESYALAPERDRSIIDRAEKDEKTGRWVAKPREPHHYPELGGLTRLDWFERQRKPIADAGTVQVFERGGLVRLDS